MACGVVQSVSVMRRRSVADAGTSSSPTEQQSDMDFLSPLQRVTSLADVIHHADADSSWQRLAHAPILGKPTTPSSSRRRGPYSPRPADDHSSSRPARRSLFGRRRDVGATPLRDVGNMAAWSAAPRPSYGRCASDTAAARPRPTRPPALIKSQSASTATLTAAVIDNDDQRLVGDFTRPLCLPVVSDTKHCDLNAISHHTVSCALGDSDVISFRIYASCFPPPSCE